MKIEVVCGTGFAGCTHRDTLKIDDEELEDMDEEEVQEYLEEVARNWAFSFVGIYFHVVEDET